VAAATVSGQVLDQQDQPVSGASVYFVSAPVSMPDVALQTDSAGRFVLGVPAAGAYRIGINAKGYSPLEHDVTIAAGQPVTLTLRLGATK
jgi:hypothetical protein